MIVRALEERPSARLGRFETRNVNLAKTPVNLGEENATLVVTAILKNGEFARSCLVCAERWGIVIRTRHCIGECEKEGC
jgi:hypothetical protein